MPDDVLQRSADWRSRADRRVRSCDFAAEFDIDRAPVWPVDDARLEPILLGGPQWIEFAEADRLNLEPAHQSLDAALVVGFDEPDDGGGFDRLQQRAEEPPSPPSQRAPAIGIIGSLGVHLLPLLLLLGWGAAPSEVAAAIPVRLVIEELPQPPAPEPTPPASTPLASDEMGETSKTTTLVAPPHRRPPPPQLPQPRIAALAPPPPKPSLPAKPTPAAAAAPRPRLA
jgi:hypothetical protein